MSPQTQTIGILGGMGPQAGFDLATMVTAETLASRDQDHLPVVVWSQPGIPDRTAWLSDPSAPDPAPAMTAGFLALERAGAGVAGMACNTAHTPVLFDRVRAQLGHAGARIRVLHLIEETVAAIRHAHPDLRNVGILATRGTLTARLYHDALEEAGFAPLSHSDPDRLTEAIYSPVSGIKACAHPVTTTARTEVELAARELVSRGSEAIILGCTELPLALPGTQLDGLPLINPGRMLARALIRAADPAKLRPVP
jgi:aspartate racemase